LAHNAIRLKLRQRLLLHLLRSELAIILEKPEEEMSLIGFYLTITVVIIVIVVFLIFIVIINTIIVTSTPSSSHHLLIKKGEEYLRIVSKIMM
jgi:hypothetical protein